MNRPERMESPEREFRQAGEIRTYALRQARMSPAQRRSYQELTPRYAVPYRASPTDVRSYYGEPERPLIMEIGFGMGEGTAAIAATLPDRNFLGVEVYKPGVGKLLARVHEDGLENVRVIVHDAVEVVRDMLPAELLDGVHVFFPDPWPKKRHHKRRLIQPGFMELLRSRLRVGGYVYAVTDWEDYALQMLEVFDTAEGYVNRHGGFCERAPWRPRTSFERKGLGQAHAIYDIRVERSS